MVYLSRGQLLRIASRIRSFHFDPLCPPIPWAQQGASRRHGGKTTQRWPAEDAQTPSTNGLVITLASLSRVNWIRLPNASSWVRQGSARRFGIRPPIAAGSSGGGLDAERDTNGILAGGCGNSPPQNRRGRPRRAESGNLMSWSHVFMMSSFIVPRSCRILRHGHLNQGPSRRCLEIDR